MSFQTKQVYAKRVGIDILNTCKKKKKTSVTQAGLQTSTGQAENEEEKEQRRELLGWRRKEVDRSPAYVP